MVRARPTLLIAGITCVIAIAIACMLIVGRRTPVTQPMAKHAPASQPINPHPPGEGLTTEFISQDYSSTRYPQNCMFRHRGDARRVVFACDATGSMLNKLTTLKDQLSVAIDGLQPGQAFNLIFFCNDKCLTLSPSLLPATPENKRKANLYLDDFTVPGTTDPLPGLELAFKQRADLIYVLTDGDFPDNRAIRDLCLKRNDQLRARINTIAFVDDTDADTSFLETLKTISKDSNGVYSRADATNLDPPSR